MKDDAQSAAQSSVQVQAIQASQKQQGKAPASAALLLAIESREWARARKLIASGANVHIRDPRVGFMATTGALL